MDTTLEEKKIELESLIPVPGEMLKTLNIEDISIFLIHRSKPVLYKKAGTPVSEKLLEEIDHNRVFYIQRSDSTKLINQVEEHFRKLLKKPPSVENLTDMFSQVGKMVDFLLKMPNKENLNAAVNFSKQLSNYIEENPKAAYLMGFILQKDFTTALHVSNVSALVSGFAYHLGMRGEELNHITSAALLHDIGKSRVPDSILKKPGKLTKEEFEIIKKHTIWGARILEENGLAKYSKAALYHHENSDGSGYPRGLPDIKIPEDAKIIKVCDVYEALTGIRPYRNSVDPFPALTIMQEEFVNVGKMNKELYRKFVNYLYKNRT